MAATFWILPIRVYWRFLNYVDLILLHIFPMYSKKSPDILQAGIDKRCRNKNPASHIFSFYPSAMTSFLDAIYRNLYIKYLIGINKSTEKLNAQNSDNPGNRNANKMQPTV